jgi:hypothetical protein
MGLNTNLMNILVTHLSPDLDALTSCWLIKRFLTGWEKAEIKYVPAGDTLNNQSPDNDPNIIHVDTGLGRFDHHQTNEYTSATKLVFEYLENIGKIKSDIKIPLTRLIILINDIDHFGQVYYPEPMADRYDLNLYQLIEGLRNIQDENQFIQSVFTLLDSALFVLKNKTTAEEAVSKGLIIKTHWGKGIIMETKSADALNIALKMHFSIVIKRDPIKGSVRIKTLPGSKYDLTNLYNKILKIDKKGTWFLHVSKNMLLNATANNPKLVPTSLSLKKLIEIIRSL